MSQLLSVEGNNWITYEKFKLILEGDPSIFIGGDNKDTPSMLSNGVGKSLIFDSIVWCLYDRTVRGFGKDGVIGPFEKYTSIKSCWRDDEGRIIAVTRYRKHPTHKNNAVVEIDGIPASKVTTIKDLGTNAQIVKLLGIDDVAFLHSVVFSKGRDSICDAKEANRRKLLSHILNLDRFDKAQKIARADKRKNEKIQHALNVKHASLETEVVELKARMGDAKLGFEEEKARVTKALKNIKTSEQNKARERRRLKRDIGELRGRLGSLRRLDSEQRDSADKISDLYRQLGQLRSRQRKVDSTYKSALRERKRATESIAKSQCHECGQAIVDQIFKFKKKAAAQKILLKDASREREELLVKVDEISKSIKVKSKKLDPSIDRKLIKTEMELKNNKRKLKELSEKSRDIEDNTPRLEKRLAALKKRYKAAKKSLNDVEYKQDITQRKIEVADFWVDGFGPKGIKKYIINGVLDYLEKKANEYLNELTDGYMKVEWQSEKKLKKSGAKRDVLMLNVTTGNRGNKEYHVCSLGEQARVWLAMELALNSVIRSTIDLALVDEAFDGLDPIGVKRAIKMMSDEGSRRKIVCISHEPGIDQFFAKKKMVTLENDKSRLAAA